VGENDPSERKCAICLLKNLQLCAIFISCRYERGHCQPITALERVQMSRVKVVNIIYKMAFTIYCYINGEYGDKNH